MDSMEVPFKVYARLGRGSGSKVEVRRFGVDRGAVANYQYLVAKLEDVYPTLRGSTYSVAWRDEEGDEITISSDEEVLLALQNMRGDMMRLYVERSDDGAGAGAGAPRGAAAAAAPSAIVIDMPFMMPPCGAGDSADDAAAEAAEAAEAEAAEALGLPAGLHRGVVCDGCEGAVVGYRYRCTSCRDYDLCHACEAAGRHSHHCMLRIPFPMNRLHVKSKIKRSRHMKPGCGEEMRAEMAEATECPYFKKQRRDKSGEHRHHMGGRRGRAGWLSTVAAYMNEFANLAGDVAAPGAPAAAAAPGAPATNAENGETTVPEPAPRAPQEAGPAPTNTPNETGEVPVLPQIQLDKLLNPENMKYVLEIQKTLASILLPTLGGDEEAAARERASAASQTERPAAAQASSQTGTQASSLAGTQASSLAGTQASSPTGTRASSRAGSQLPGESSMESVKETPVKDHHMSSPDRADGWTMINNIVDLMDVGVPPTAPLETAQPIGFKDLPRTFTDKLNINDGSSLYPNLGSSVGSGAAIPMPAPQAASFPPQLPATTSQASPLPPAPTPQAASPAPQRRVLLPETASGTAPNLRVRHPKPHIEAAINQMMSMGFTNEGGWLTQLLESRDGNISAVLDLLTPVNVKRP